MTNSRRKGSDGEREFRDVLRSYGFAAERDGRLEADLAHNVEGVHFEIKRREKYEIQSWLEQAERDAGSAVPCVVFRRSRQPWRVIVPASEYLRLKRLEAHLAIEGESRPESLSRSDHGRVGQENRVAARRIWRQYCDLGSEAG